MSELNLKTFLTKSSEELMGNVIDFIRASSLGDRQFEQVQRSVKKMFRESNLALIEVIKEVYPEINVDDDK